VKPPIGSEPPRRSKRLVEWIGLFVMAAATFAAMAHSIHDALVRYQELRSGWSWDLAYYNQWCWAFTHGDQKISVQPIADYATEGPSVWKTNYLAPIRYAILPIYRLWPDPKTLLIVHSILFWLILPASYGLVFSETRSVTAAVLALVFVWLTPLLTPLAANDFRELQLAVPFVIWAVHGVRARSLWLAALGVFGTLACRQEYALFVASLAIIPPLKTESIVSRYRWSRALWMGGLCWMTLVFFGYLMIVGGWGTPASYVQQFTGPKASLTDTLATGFDFLAVGLGTWSLLALAFPRALLLFLPWLWSLSSGRWALGLIRGTAWHHVRYAAPFAATGVAAGLLGASRLWRFASRFPYAWLWRSLAAMVALVGMLLVRTILLARFAEVPVIIDPAEAAQLWEVVPLVGAGDGVLAHYDVTAPLSSRRLLFSYVMRQNQPVGYPNQLPEFITWAWIRKGDVAPQTLLDQGFALFFNGPSIQVFHRERAVVPGTS
jgi:hypothetical protein